MKVRIVENWQANALEVYVFERQAEGATDGTMHRHVGGDGWRVEDVGEIDKWTQRPKPSVVLPLPVLDSIIEQYRRDHPEPTADAVADARATRDRLLVLVEKAALDALDVVGLVDKARGEPLTTIQNFTGNVPGAAVDLSVDELWSLVFEAAGAATAPLLADNPAYTYPSERVADAVRRVLAERGFIEPPVGYRRRSP